MTDQDLIDAHDKAYDRARDCGVSASADRADDWMRLYGQMKERGLVSLRHPHLFPRRTPSCRE